MITATNGMNVQGGGCEIVRVWQAGQPITIGRDQQFILKFPDNVGIRISPNLIVELPNGTSARKVRADSDAHALTYIEPNGTRRDYNAALAVNASVGHNGVQANVGGTNYRTQTFLMRAGVNNRLDFRFPIDTKFINPTNGDLRIYPIYANIHIQGILR